MFKVALPETSSDFKMTCPSCGKDSLTQEENSCEVYTVCSICGTVVSNETDVRTTSLTGTTFSNGAFMSQIPGLTSSQKYNKNVVIGERTVDVLGSQFHMGTQHKYEALLYFKPFSSQKDAYVTAAACVFIVLRKHGQPLSLGDMSVAVQRDINLLKSRLDMICKHNSISVSSAELSDLIPGIVEKLNIPLQDDSHFQEMVKLVSEITDFCKKRALAGRSQPQPFIAACSFIAWQSIYPSNPLMKNIKQFCSKCKLSRNTRTISRMHTKIIDSFQTVIPEVKKRHVPRMLKKILLRGILQEEISDKDCEAQEYASKEKYNEMRIDPPNHPVSGLEEEINDDEIMKYIRSDEEVRIAAKILNEQWKDVK